MTAVVVAERGSNNFLCPKKLKIEELTLLVAAALAALAVVVICS